jgi:hypothetical protein
MKLSLLFLLSLFYIPHPLSNRLMPEEDIIFENGAIYYVIPSNSMTFIPPLTLNLSYRLVSDPGPYFGETNFTEKDEVKAYLTGKDPVKMQVKDKELYLRALALYYIWISEKKAEPVPELDTILENLEKDKDSKIRGFAGLVKEILL